MFERKIYNDIISWHESLKIKKRALIIKGLRQIGKTTIVRKFCEEHYENVVYIDFMHNTSVKSLFDKDLNPLIFLGSVALVHSILAIFSKRDPQLGQIISAQLNLLSKKIPGKLAA